MSIGYARYGILIVLCGTMLSLALSCGGGGGTTYTVIRNTPPSIGAPSSISAVAGSGSVTVTWSAVTGATSYNVYSSPSAAVSKATGTKHTVTGTTYVDTGLLNGTQYYYVMTSVNGSVESADSSVVSAIPGDVGLISGTITYEDKELGADASVRHTGYFTGNTTMKAVRYAVVDVVSATTSSILHTTLTNSLGMYSIPISTGTTSVYVRVNSEATPTGGTQPITVMNLSNDRYGVPSANITLTGSANVNISIPTTNLAAGAFNILDVMTTGYDFIKSLAGSYPAVPLNVFWAPGNLKGTYYCKKGCTQGNVIYVLSQTGGDTDEYDDDVLWHEFGHFVASTYSLDDSPGGIHYLGDDEQDLRLSWSEGWGNFFPGAVKNWLFASGQSGLISSAAGVTLTTYVDTSGSAGFSFDFGSSSVYSSYSSNEVAVAKLLTDLTADSTMQNIWSVITDFSSKPPPVTEPVNLELFWDRWLFVNKPDATALANLVTIYSARLITYQNDIYELNNTYLTAATYTFGSPQTHTLYSSTLGTDMDYVAFSATNGTTHTITTSNFRNGADTFLTLYSSSGTTIVATDDNGNGTNVIYTPCVLSNMSCDNGFPANNATNLSSKVSFVAGYTGDYYIEVRSSPTRPTSAGRYGSYTLTITSP